MKRYQVVWRLVLHDSSWRKTGDTHLNWRSQNWRISYLNSNSKVNFSKTKLLSKALKLQSGKLKRYHSSLAEKMRSSLSWSFNAKAKAWNFALNWCKRVKNPKILKILVMIVANCFWEKHFSW